MTEPSAERIEKMQIEVERLQSLIASLDRDRSGVPKLWLFNLLALPAGWLWGLTGVFLTLAGTAVLVATAYYIIGVRRNEYQWTLDQLNKQLRS